MGFHKDSAQKEVCTRCKRAAMQSSKIPTALVVDDYATSPGMGEAQKPY